MVETKSGSVTGLAARLAEEAAAATARRSGTGAGEGALQDGQKVLIPLGDLTPNKLQPRKWMDPASIAQIKTTLLQHGLLQDISVKPLSGGKFMVIAGGTRFEAYKQLHADEALPAETREKFARIPAVVRLGVDDVALAEGAYIENAARSDLNEVDDAEALAGLMDMLGLKSAKALAERVGREERVVKSLLQLAAAPNVVKTACRGQSLKPFLVVKRPELAADVAVADGEERTDKRIVRDTAIEFAKLHKHHAQRTPSAANFKVAKALQRAIDEAWTVARARAYVQAQKDRKPDAPDDDTPEPIFKRDEKRFALDLRRLADASVEEIERARAEVESVFAEALRVASERAATRPEEDAA